MNDTFTQTKLEEIDKVAQTLGDSGYCGRCAYYQKELRGWILEAIEHGREEGRRKMHEEIERMKKRYLYGYLDTPETKAYNQALDDLAKTFLL